MVSTCLHLGYGKTCEWLSSDQFCTADERTRDACKRTIMALGDHPQSSTTTVKCPSCGEPDLTGPVDYRFMCYKCGYAPKVKGE